MAGGVDSFRNLLVHVYADVDDGWVYDIMQDDLVVQLLKRPAPAKYFLLSSEKTQWKL